MTPMRKVLAAVAGAPVFLCPCINAQEYPTKPVRIIVPFAAAGGTDILARSLAQRLSETIGQQFIVDNRSGGNCLIGGEITRALGHESVRQRLACHGIDAAGIGPEKFAAII